MHKKRINMKNSGNEGSVKFVIKFKRKQYMACVNAAVM